MHPNCKGRSKIISVCRWYDLIRRKFLKEIVETINEFSKVADPKLTHKNQLHFYTLSMNNLKRKLRNQLYLQQHQKE